MKIYASMPSNEFIAQLRHSAIQGNASPLIIDALDRLRGVDENDPRVEELEGKIEDLESEIANLKETIEGLEKK